MRISIINIKRLNKVLNLKDIIERYVIQKNSNFELELYLMDVRLRCNQNQSVITKKMSKTTEMSM